MPKKPAVPRLTLYGSAALSLLLSGGVRAAKPDDFRVLTAADLVSLCSAGPNDPNYVPAIHFCHGFGTGAYRYYEAITTASPDQRYVCPPSPPPSRSAVVIGFVDWMKSRPGSRIESSCRSAVPIPRQDLSMQMIGTFMEER